jgi:hypothetical protein
MFLTSFQLIVGFFVGIVVSFFAKVAQTFFKLGHYESPDIAQPTGLTPA